MKSLAKAEAGYATVATTSLRLLLKARIAHAAEPGQRGIR